MRFSILAAALAAVVLFAGAKVPKPKFQETAPSPKFSENVPAPQFETKREAKKESRKAEGVWVEGRDGNQYLHDQFGHWWKYTEATKAVDFVGKEKPDGMRRGKFSKQRQCVNGVCQEVSVWVAEEAIPKAEPAVPLPVTPEVGQQSAPADNATPRRGILRRR